MFTGSMSLAHGCLITTYFGHLRNVMSLIIFALRDVLKRDWLPQFEVALETKMCGKPWWLNILTGTVYHEIYKKESSQRLGLSPNVGILNEELREFGYFLVGKYKRIVHIVRYICAVYTYCNDEEYKELRNHKVHYKLVRYLQKRNSKHFFLI